MIIQNNRSTDSPKLKIGVKIFKSKSASLIELQTYSVIRFKDGGRKIISAFSVQVNHMRGLLFCQNEGCSNSNYIPLIDQAGTAGTGGLAGDSLIQFTPRNAKFLSTGITTAHNELVYVIFDKPIIGGNIGAWGPIDSRQSANKAQTNKREENMVKIFFPYFN